MSNDLVEFKFSKHYRAYNAGEGAMVHPTLAEAMAKKGLGHVVVKAAPVADKPVNKVPKQTVSKTDE